MIESESESESESEVEVEEEDDGYSRFESRTVRSGQVMLWGRKNSKLRYYCVSGIKADENEAIQGIKSALPEVLIRARIRRFHVFTFSCFHVSDGYLCSLDTTTLLQRHSMLDARMDA